MLSSLGNTEGSSSRLNIGNALGAVAQIIAPLFIVMIVPIQVISIEGKMPYMKGVFMVTAAVLAMAAFASFFLKM